MVGAKLHIHSDEEIFPENPFPHSPPPPPAVRNRHHRRNSPLPTPRSDLRRPRARRERGAKLSEVEERFPVSSTPSPTPTRETLDFGGGFGSAAAPPVSVAPPPAMPVPVAPPPLFSDPKSRRSLPRSLILFRRLPSSANKHGGVVNACKIRLKFDKFSSSNWHLLWLHDGSPEQLDEYEDMWDLTPDTDLPKELPDDYTCETALADLIDNSLQALWSNVEGEKRLIRRGM